MLARCSEERGGLGRLCGPPDLDLSGLRISSKGIYYRKPTRDTTQAQLIPT